MRVIAGELKGRRLAAPKWEGLRPTSDKLRETLFNIIAARVPGARLLDAYAGTGAIGIEALSRGAAHVTFVDCDVRALKLIERNLTLCGVSDRYVIIRDRLGVRDSHDQSGLRRRVGEKSPWRARAGVRAFDLAVLDPPYDAPDLAAAITAAEPLIAPGGLLVLEHARRRPAPDSAGGLSRVRDVRSGDSALAFYSSTTWAKTA
jgi:16S rRNA (guanine(966)-N(2))-methyltransferase RsmD